MQTLVDQFNDSSPPLAERYGYFFPSGYPLLWGLKKDLCIGNKKLGIFMAAFEMLDELEMYDEAAECLYGCSKYTQAEKYIKEVFEKHGESPGILCLLGEMNKDDSQFEKAWEISNHKYAKAM